MTEKQYNRLRKERRELRLPAWWEFTPRWREFVQNHNTKRLIALRTAVILRRDLTEPFIDNFNTGSWEETLRESISS